MVSLVIGAESYDCELGQVNESRGLPRPQELVGEKVRREGRWSSAAAKREMVALNSYIGYKTVAMTKLRFRAVIVLAILALVAVTAMAKIMPPKPVLPVEANGVRYSADRDGQDQYAVATDMSTGKQLWKVKVFHTPIKF